ncbi:succinate dehydrogenase cytochrome b subunit [Desulfobulbus alkaliphilus]|uniref:succinate dehydrogenase cytochrome b subunit n=1 Tax=Desulfobulbus alkaliphilus TaxID=869814 RepID=UPI001963DCE8|nr:succinate dehydrogenase cytochrome b subunit [Desulfobulbus alkaliphilus]MBM9536445.1 succinate dehydrogenase cytochrome b subunit [Desulfobulbus alkaliphilus]
MSWFIQTCRSSLGKKYIMALTGFMLGGFLLVHAIGNSTIFWGREAFNAYAHHLHSLGIFVPIFEIGLYTIFLIHIVTGVILFLENRKSRGGKYEMETSAGGSTWASKTMPYTGVAILVFILIHLVNFSFPEKTEVKTIADFVTQVLNNPVFTLIYTAGIVLLLLHISHGFWSLLQTLGISHPKYDFPLRVITWALVAFMGFVYLLVVFLLVISQNHLL